MAISLTCSTSLFINNQIEPNYKSQSFITEKSIDIDLRSDLLGSGFYCLDFTPLQYNTLTLSTKDNYYSQVFIYTYGCLDLDFNKNSTPSNCANQTEIGKVINGQNAGFRLKLFTSQFNTQTKKIQINYRNDFVYALENFITSSTLKAQKQVTSVKQGFFIQDKSTFSSPIDYEKENQLWDREYSINSINQSGYGMLVLIMNEIVQQVELQYPTIPSILAL
ncbi:hypothetical protein ABPG72_014461, partial [Tetrahymena utriculariae]